MTHTQAYMTHTYRNICHTQAYSHSHIHMYIHTDTHVTHMHTGIYATHIGTHVAHTNIFTHTHTRKKKDWLRAQFIEALGLRLRAFLRDCGNSGRF